MLVLRIGNIYTDIVSQIVLPDTKWKELERTLSFRPEGYQFSPMFNRWMRDANGKPVRRMWDGWKKQFWKNTKRTYFPTGLYSIVKEFLNKHDIPFRVEDTREKPVSNFDLELSDDITLYPYQEKIINTSCNIGRGLISAPTGSGKGLIGAGIIEKLGVAPFLFFVTSIDLLLQAKEHIETYLKRHGSRLEVGQIGGGVVDIKDINVCTIQTVVRALGKKWDKQYKFDDDDTDDKTVIEQYREDIKELVYTSKGVICDECISGDSIVITKNGSVQIKDLYKYIGKKILSFIGNSVVWKKVTDFYSKGKKKTLTITLINGDAITCTEDHPIMTSQGWKLAGDLRLENTVLSCVSAGVENKLMSQVKAPANTQNMYSGTKLKKDQYTNGEKNLIKQYITPHCVGVDVENKLNCIMELSSRLCEEEEVDITSLFMDMIRDHCFGTLHYLSEKNKRFSGHFLGIHLFPFLQKEAKIQDYLAIMDCAKWNGRYSNLTFSLVFQQNTGYTKMAGMATRQPHSEHAAILNFIVLESKHEIKSLRQLKNMSRNAWNTNYVGIKSIVQSGEKEVFDITVEDTHCFFANNILVHNCQHWRADTCQLVTRELKSAYYIFGMSATCQRDSGDDLLIQACFGRKIVEITASELIRDGYLVKPDIKMIHVRGPKSPYKQWQSLYKDQVVENEVYNGMIANIANAYIQAGRLVLILIKQIKHGTTIESMVPGSIFVSGNDSKKIRETAIKNLRNRYISCICSTSLFDEGINVKALDTVILGGQGNSRTRAMQRIGRILRPNVDDAGNKKTKATAIDFCIHQKYLKNHAMAREKMYRTEPEFSIEDIDPKSHEIN